VHLTDIPCRRVKCSACKRSWTLRPPGLLPNKHYQGCVIASAVQQHVLRGDSLEQVARDHGCSRRQVGRWSTLTAAMADPAVLASMLVEAVDAVVLPAKYEIAKRLQALRNETRRRVLERAAQVLALAEALASALALEPPGLRAILERFLAGRTGVGTYRRPAIPELARGAQLM
jgi:transposase-like protein